MRYTIAFALTLSLAFPTLVSGCGDPAQAAPPAAVLPPLVQVAAVEQDDRPAPVSAIGVLASKAERRLSFKVGGLIEKITVDEGQTVRRGQLLASLVLPEIDAQVAAAEAAHDKALRDKERVAKLHTARVTTDEQLQNATTGVDLTRAQLEAVRFNRAHAVIVAPSGGRVLKRTAEEGELVAPGTPIFWLASSEAGWVLRVAVPDRDVVRLALGDAARVRFDALGEAAFGARVSELASAATPQTGLFEVEVVLTEAPPTTLSGLVGRVEITPSKRTPQAWIPLDALIDGEGSRASVYVLDGDRARRVSITTGRIEGGKVAVSAGLEGHAQVITAGRTKIADQQAVRLAEVAR